MAATVALGVLVAPSTLLKSPVSPWTTPPSVTSSTPSRTTPSARPTTAPTVTTEVPPPLPAPPLPSEVPTETTEETLERTTEAPRPTTPAPAPRPSSVPSSTPPAPPPPPPSPEPEVQLRVGPLDLSLDLPNANLWAADVAPQVADIKHRFGVGTVVTRPGHSPDQYHAADFMTSDQAKGDALAAYALGLPGVEYAIWQQRYNDGSGWSPMEDRGTPTANHMDHVHVSFY